MSWKDWPYWLKGGGIGGILLSIYHIILLFTYELIFPYGVEDFKYFFLYTIIIHQKLGVYFFIFSPLIIFIIGFLFGVLIGWIYGKIKRGKNEK